MDQQLEDAENDYFFIKEVIKKAIIEDCDQNTDKKKSIGKIQNWDNTDNIKLPKIDIPEFRGKYEDSEIFSDLFESMIHKNQNISDVEKPYYLKSYIKGEAEALVKNIQIFLLHAITKDAWEMLSSRYNNKILIVESRVKNILNYPAILKKASVQTLLDNVMKTLRLLKLLGLKVEMWDVWTVYIVTLKLDPETRRWGNFIILQLKLKRSNNYKSF